MNLILASPAVAAVQLGGSPSIPATSQGLQQNKSVRSGVLANIVENKTKKTDEVSKALGNRRGASRAKLVDVTQEQQRSVPILYSRGQRVPKRTAVGPSVAHSEKLEPPQLTTDVSHGI